MSSEKTIVNKHLFHCHIDLAARNLLNAIRLAQARQLHNAPRVGNGVSIHLYQRQVGQEINAMINFANAGRRFLAGIALAWLSSIAPAFADTYDIGLFEGVSTIGTGSGQFTFTKTTAGTFPITPTALSTNTNSAIATQCKPPASPPCTYSFLTNSNLNVVVSPVNFSDGKTPPNTITGNYVEGLTGFADSPDETTNRFVTCNATGTPASARRCFYRITFTFVPGAPTSNPSTWTRTFTIERMARSASGVVTVDALVVANGRYFVRNTVNSAPEPGSLALVVLALAALAWRRWTFRPATV